MDLRADQDPRASGHRNRVVSLWLVLLVATGVPLGYLWWDFQHVVLDEAPGFTLTSTGYENGTLGEGVEFTLEEYRGRVVVLDMMAVTCTTCRIVTQEVLLPLHEKHPEVVILSIDTWADPATGSSFGESREELIKLQQSEGTPWRHALDTDQVYLKYSAIALPQIHVVDPDGRLTYTGRGTPSFADVDQAVQAASVAGQDSVALFQGGVLAIALVAGVASFFSPCSVGLVPAYMGFLLRDAQGAAPATRVARTLRAGVATGIGIVTVYGVLAVLLWLLSASGFGPQVRAALPRMGSIMGAILVLLGLLMLFGVSWDRIAARLGIGRIDGRRGFYAFGLGYGLAAFGCTGPIFLPVLLAAFLAGPVLGGLAFLVYSLAIVAFVLLAAALVASGHEGGLRRLLEKTTLITRVSALLLIGAGAYLVWFDVRAGII